MGRSHEDINYLNTISKVSLTGTLLLLEPWSNVIDSYAASSKVVMVPAILFLFFFLLYNFFLWF